MLYLSKKTGSTTSSELYYYMLNLQGDVVHLVNTSGKAVASYSYDPYGTVISKSGSIADLNPLRYRGYYYDPETGFYYLQSRYYDPALGRFINADSYTSTGTGYLGYNMFAYCENRPTIASDPKGEFLHIVIGAAVGGVIGAVSTVVSGGDIIDVGIGFLSGAGGGALAASGAGVVLQAAGSAAIAMTSNAAQQANHIFISKTETSFDVGDMLADGAVGLVCGAWGGNGASYGNTAGINSAGKQILKRGLFDSAARSYYRKTAHRLGGDFVLKPLFESLGKSALGTAAVTVKNKVRARRNQSSRAYHSPVCLSIDC